MNSSLFCAFPLWKQTYKFSFFKWNNYEMFEKFTNFWILSLSGCFQWRYCLRYWNLKIGMWSNWIRKSWQTFGNNIKGTKKIPHRAVKFYAGEGEQNNIRKFVLFNATIFDQKTLDFLANLKYAWYFQSANDLYKRKKLFPLNFKQLQN